MIDFDKIEVRAGQLESLAFALETAIIEMDDGRLNNPEGTRMQDLFYVLMEQIETLNKEITELHGHIAVCNAVYAVNHVNDLKSEINKPKSESEGQE